jgi:imidazole glycerol-phosphate synthase subunit HisH
MQTIVVIDYGLSNLRSVSKALEQVSSDQQQIIVSDIPEQILKADRIVFPGQGAIGQCTASLREKMLDQVLLECLGSKPFLGLCLGLHTLLDFSSEDDGTDGLGIIPGQVDKFPKGNKDQNDNVFKIPHMGWNQVDQRQDHPLWKNIKSGEYFYFAHSYYASPSNNSDIAATSNYIFDFTSAIARDNLFAVQFHPEKSHRAGLQLLENFLKWE